MTAQESIETHPQPIPVLIVDDDIWMQRILSRTLESMGFEALVASNGYDAVAVALERKPAVIFLDILMPDLSGHQTLKLLKRLKATRSIPVIMITALSDTENLGLAVKEGAAGFIRKPFTRALILEKLQELLGSELVQALAVLRLQQKTPEPEEEVPTPSPAAPAPVPPGERHNVHPGEALRRYQVETDPSAFRPELIKELLLRPPQPPPSHLPET